ncbi:hypothetical protein [Streptomyces sp. SDr-06]|uniref:hypothetical protein n=1 Tax=Streptomyces sp. SDr-06 TaxID=2267702 RepID=UPI000DE96BB0|nr:hypothetical protein [Streptomyces sp. SDr-06]
MHSATPNLLTQVRHALQQAGFQLTDNNGAAASGPGLAVTQVPAGVLIKWTASDGFTALANDQPGISGDSMHTAVQAAITGLLLQLGHTLTNPSQGGDVLVLDDRPDGGAVQHPR